MLLPYCDTYSGYVYVDLSKMGESQYTKEENEIVVGRGRRKEMGEVQVRGYSSRCIGETHPGKNVVQCETFC